jgi:hypothetical protein
MEHEKTPSEQDIEALKATAAQVYIGTSPTFVEDKDT